MPRERDYTLDLLKTLGCLLMVFAHSHAVTNNWFTHYVVFSGTFAPVLFFGVCGVTSVFQLRSRPWPVLATFYALFFLLGLSFIGIKGVNFWREPQCEIFQGIALGVVATALLVRLLGEKSGFLFPLPFLLYVLCKKAVVTTPVTAGFLFPPGLFPLFPWLSFFLWGVFCYWFRRMGFLLALSAAGIYLSLVVAGKGHCEKWEMNAGYFLLGLALYGLLFGLCSIRWRVPQWLIYTGKHSLLFFYTHYLVLFLWRAAGLPLLPLLVWPATLAGAVAFCLLLTAVNQLIVSPRLVYPRPAAIFWGLLIGIILFAPTMVPPAALPWVSYGCGFLFALNYRALNKLVLCVACHRESLLGNQSYRSKAALPPAQRNYNLAD